MGKFLLSILYLLACAGGLLAQPVPNNVSPGNLVPPSSAWTAPPYYGSVVAISGSIVAVSAFYDTGFTYGNATNTGNAAVLTLYDTSSGTPLEPCANQPGSTGGFYFGRSVVLANEGTFLAVGDPKAQSVYYYTLSPGFCASPTAPSSSSLSAASPTSAQKQFGEAMAATVVGGDVWLVVGSPQYQFHGTASAFMPTCAQGSSGGTCGIAWLFTCSNAAGASPYSCTVQSALFLAAYTNNNGFGVAIAPYNSTSAIVVTADINYASPFSGSTAQGAFFPFLCGLDGSVMACSTADQAFDGAVAATTDNLYANFTMTSNFLAAPTNDVSLDMYAISCDDTSCDLEYTIDLQPSFDYPTQTVISVDSVTVSVATGQSVLVVGVQNPPSIFMYSCSASRYCTLNSTLYPYIQTGDSYYEDYMVFSIAINEAVDSIVIGMPFVNGGGFSPLGAANFFTCSSGAFPSCANLRPNSRAVINPTNTAVNDLQIDQYTSTQYEFSNNGNFGATVATASGYVFVGYPVVFLYGLQTSSDEPGFVEIFLKDPITGHFVLPPGVSATYSCSFGGMNACGASISAATITTTPPLAVAAIGAPFAGDLDEGSFDFVVCNAVANPSVTPICQAIYSELGLTNQGMLGMATAVSTDSTNVYAFIGAPGQLINPGYVIALVCPYDTTLTNPVSCNSPQKLTFSNQGGNANALNTFGHQIAAVNNLAVVTDTQNQVATVIVCVSSVCSPSPTLLSPSTISPWPSTIALAFSSDATLLAIGNPSANGGLGHVTFYAFDPLVPSWSTTPASYKIDHNSFTPGLYPQDALGASLAFDSAKNLVIALPGGAGVIIVDCSSFATTSVCTLLNSGTAAPGPNTPGVEPASGFARSIAVDPALSFVVISNAAYAANEVSLNGGTVVIMYCANPGESLADFCEPLSSFERIGHAIPRIVSSFRMKFEDGNNKTTALYKRPKSITPINQRSPHWERKYNEQVFTANIRYNANSDTDGFMATPVTTNWAPFFSYNSNVQQTYFATIFAINSQGTVPTYVESTACSLQATTLFQNMNLALKSRGFTFASVARMTVYLTETMPGDDTTAGCDTSYFNSLYLTNFAQAGLKPTGTIIRVANFLQVGAPNNAVIGIDLVAIN